jgi:hypothetical protein
LQVEGLSVCLKDNSFIGDPYEFDEETGSLLESFKRSNKVWARTSLVNIKTIKGSIFDAASISFIITVYACRHSAT